jgi:hypothetical protein
VTDYLIDSYGLVYPFVQWQCHESGSWHNRHWRAFVMVEVAIVKQLHLMQTLTYRHHEIGAICRMHRCRNS